MPMTGQVRRGEVPLVHKAAQVQAAGGLGIIIVDNGICTNGFDQFCCPGADKSRGEGTRVASSRRPCARECDRG